MVEKTIRALATLTAAVAATGARAHPGNLVLAWVTSNVQQARHYACTHNALSA